MFPMQDKLEELRKALQNLKKQDKILIIADNDPDGISASFIFCRLLEKYNLKYKTNFFVKLVEHDFRGLIANLPETQKELLEYNYIFLLDLSLNDYSFLSKNIFICVIDHHKVKSNVNLEINPTNYFSDNKKMVSTSALVYSAYRFIVGDDKILQKIGFVGALCDCCAIHSLQYLSIELNDEEYFVNDGQILPILPNLLIPFSLLCDEKYNGKWIFERLLVEVKTNLISLLVLPEEFHKRLNIYKLKSEKRVSTIFANAKICKKIIFLDLVQKDRGYKTMINANLQLGFPDKTSFVFFENKKEKGYNVSCRSRDYDLVKLIEFLKSECKTMFGGWHSAAAGFFVEKTEYEKCKKLIIENLKKFKK